MSKNEKDMPTALAVYLGERRIGVITRLAGDNNLFSFDEDYLEDPERPTLSLSFKTASGKLATNIRPVRTRVPTFFSNLLPEGKLREYLAMRANVKPQREFFLLHALGVDLPGAVVIKPIRTGVVNDSYRHASHSDDMENLLRFSLAGVQLKFSAIVEASGNLTVPATGIGGQWIVKLPSTRFPTVPENEFVMMELARRINIPVPRTRLIPIDRIHGLPDEVEDISGNAFAVERFDRLLDGGRVHIEDFAQVFGLFPERKYQQHSYANLATVLLAEAGQESVNDFMRRLVFSVLVGNGDMHLKNWSLIYRDGRTPALAPAYDYVATIPYLPKDKLALSFGGSKDIFAISREQVRRFADKAGLAVSPLWCIVEDTVEQTVEAWRGHTDKEMLPNAMQKTISQHIEKVATKTLVEKSN